LYRGLAELAGWGQRRTWDACCEAVVDFAPEVAECPRCASSLRVWKTSKRKLATLIHGDIEAREIQQHCLACGVVVRSRRLAKIAPRGQRYGYDVIVWVGLRRWIDRLQRVEIRDRLASQYGIRVSTGTISTLADRFLAYLGALHQKAVPALRREMPHGYPLHIDATAYRGRSGQFVCYDGWRGWVLHSGRIEGERTEEIQPVVEQTVDWFGRPIAVVRDQSKACKAAVEQLASAGVPDLLCHYHVLKNLGTRLLYRPYQRLKTEWGCLNAGTILKDLFRSLSQGKTAGHVQLGAAVFWVLRGDDSRQLPFPFALTILAQLDRLLILEDQLEAFIDLRRSRTVADELEALRQLISDVANDAELADLYAKMHQRRQIFDEVRGVFRLVDPTKDEQPPLPELEEQQIREIKNDFTEYRTVLRQRILKATGDSQAALKSVLKCIDGVKGQLFGHPVMRDNTGKALFVVDRTNNPVEHFFSRQNQAMRRRTGRKNLGRDLEDLPAEAALVHNLQQPSYVRIVLGSLDQLPARFASTRPLEKPLRPRPLAAIKRHLHDACPQFMHTAIHPPGDALATGS
jgi:hypothetical protein